MHWCVAANPAEPLPHKRTAPVRMRRVPPKASTLQPASRAPISYPVACEHPIPHKREAVAEVAVDTEALICSGSRCSSP